MRILLTGAAGFIGHHASLALARAGASLVGVDALTPYYDVRLKERRLERLVQEAPAFAFERMDVADADAFAGLVARTRPDVVLHLAAQAGVRYSLEAPFSYVDANVRGHLSVLEACRRLEAPPRIVYASSSSVYGANTDAVFREDDRVDRPRSLYAATKRAAELMSHTYADLYGLRQTGLRFFTVYGPWGRPDMAYWRFTDAILNGRPIDVFNGGDLMRDFTYIDDVVDALVRIVTGPPVFHGDVPHEVYNIGNNRPERLLDFVAALEEAIGRPAERRLLPMQPGDVHRTAADIAKAGRDYGFVPRTGIRTGLARFVAWYRDEWLATAGAAPAATTATAR